MKATSATTGVGVAMSGNVDFSGGDVRLAAGFAGTRMPVESLKRMWPVFITPKVRDWFNEHLTSGTVERIVIAVNSPLENLKAGGPPVADDGLSIDALATGCVLRPVDGLPALRDADLNVHIVGRDAVRLARQGDRRPAVRAQAHADVRRVRSARHRAESAAGARALQARGSGAGRGRAFAHGPPARRFRCPVRPCDGPRHDDRAGHARDAAQGRSAAGLDHYRDHASMPPIFPPIT